MTPDKLLLEAAKLFRKRNPIYGSSYLRVGKMTCAMFPNGLTLKSETDHVRFQILVMLMAKFARYAHNWERGHDDSIADAIVYCAMLRSMGPGPKPGAARVPHLRRRSRKRVVRR